MTPSNQHSGPEVFSITAAGVELTEDLVRKSDYDALVEQLEALDLDNARLRNALRRIADAPWKSATVTGHIARKALDREANPYPASEQEAS